VSQAGRFSNSAVGDEASIPGMIAARWSTENLICMIFFD
jgi:hypothetical protein